MQLQVSIDNPDMHNKFKAEQETYHEDVEMACNSKIKDTSETKADPSLRF
jgi:hypothetical protein